MWLSVGLCLRSGSFPANNSPTSYCGLQNRVKSSCQQTGNGCAGGHLAECQLLLTPSVQCSVSPSLFTACALSSGTQLPVPLQGEKLRVPPLLYLAYLTPEPHQILHWESVALLLDFSSSSSWTFYLLLSAKWVYQHPWFCCQFSLLLSPSLSLFLRIYTFKKKIIFFYSHFSEGGRCVPPVLFSWNLWSPLIWMVECICTTS